MKLQEALAQSRPQIGATCATARMLEAVDANTRAEILDALDDKSLSNAHLSRAFTLLGFKMADGAVQRHRAGGCRCAS